jgi:hypothetical protein
LSHCWRGATNPSIESSATQRTKEILRRTAHLLTEDYPHQIEV